MTLRDCYIAGSGNIRTAGIQYILTRGTDWISFYGASDNRRFEGRRSPRGSCECLSHDCPGEESGAKGIYFTNCILNGGGGVTHTLVEDGFSGEWCCVMSGRAAPLWNLLAIAQVTAGVTMDIIYTTDTCGCRQQIRG